MHINFDVIWAIWPEAMQAILNRIEVAMPHIEAGPADDAERLGLLRKVGNQAVIPVMGPIVKRQSFLTDFFGFSSAMAIQAAVRAAASDPEVERIVLEIDSPGGSVDGLPELADEIFQARESKEIVAQVSGIAASAAFLIASQTDRIFTGRMDMVGSIGTRMLLFDFSEAFKENGIKAIAIDTGEFKSAGAFGTKITEAQIKEFQRIIDGFFDDFVASVVRGRGMSEKDVRKVGDGRMFFADEAMSLGLIDGVQTREETLASAPESSKRRRTPHAELALQRQKVFQHGG